jgi:hypothetical protein
LIAYITKNSFAYLKDIAEFFKGSAQGVSAALARLKINLKKQLLRTQSVTRKNVRNLTEN